MGEAKEKRKKIERFGHFCDLICKKKMTDIEKLKAWKRSTYPWIKHKENNNE